MTLYTDNVSDGLWVKVHCLWQKTKRHNCLGVISALFSIFPIRTECLVSVGLSPTTEAVGVHCCRGHEKRVHMSLRVFALRAQTF